MIGSVLNVVAYSSIIVFNSQDIDYILHFIPVIHAFRYLNVVSNLGSLNHSYYSLLCNKMYIMLLFIPVH